MYPNKKNLRISGLRGSLFCTQALASLRRHRHTRHADTQTPRSLRRTDPSDMQTIHLVNHRVLVHEIFAQFLASNLCLDIRDEVLNVLNGLLFLGDEFRHVIWRVIAYQKMVEVPVADV